MYETMVQIRRNLGLVLRAEGDTVVVHKPGDDTYYVYDGAQLRHAIVHQGLMLAMA